ncbi:MAG: hypothetical protein L0322_01275, partial [Chloroflexi bacterium]|nr:hypothetical protein [Chloroflexota bacterium]
LFLVGRPKLADWALLLTAGTLVGLYVFYWADGIMYGPRYFYAALPAFLLLTARGVEATGRRLGGQAGRAAVWLLLLAFIAGNLVSYLPAYMAGLPGFNFLTGRPLAVVRQQVEEPAVVFVAAERGDWWEYGSLFSGNTPWLDGPIIYARDRGEEENARLLALYPGRRAYLLAGDELIPLPD